MTAKSRLTFKIASEDWELEAIHRLNYETFVEEIPQHAPTAARRLVDKFHPDNTYVVALAAGELVGMVALRGKRPFSLDGKLHDLDSYLPPKHRVCEIRLLAVVPAFRRGSVFRGLMQLLSRHGKSEGYDLAVISGVLRQVGLYRHLGFVPFGPEVGSGDARFQPMYLTLERFEEGAEHSLERSRPVSFLPGPVALRREVRRAFTRAPVSHRDGAFHALRAQAVERLRGLTGARHVQLLLGSGTVANDAVAGQLSLARQRGLILVNGEFGRRLADHAARWRLDFDLVEVPWGETFDLELVKRRLAAEPRPRWLWVTHCETSTGVLNDLDGFATVCTEHGVELCLDAISSLGSVPVDLSRVHLASGVGGKALGSYPGLSMVFHGHEIAPAPESLPRYLDLGFYADQEGVPFTQSSNLLAALAVALERPSWTDRFAELEKTSTWLRQELCAAGLQLVGCEDQVSPTVITVALPPGLDSRHLGEKLRRAGFLLSYASGYLVARNWIQICLMGEIDRRDLESLIGRLAAEVNPKRARPEA